MKTLLFALLLFPALTLADMRITWVADSCATKHNVYLDGALTAELDNPEFIINNNTFELSEVSITTVCGSNESTPAIVVKIPKPSGIVTENVIGN